MTQRSVSAPEPWVPASCTLPSTERPLRTAEFDDLFADGVRAVHATSDRVSLELAPDPGVAARAAELTVRETSCCSFFSFTLAATAGRLLLEVTAPPEHAGVLTALAARAQAVHQ